MRSKGVFGGPKLNAHGGVPVVYDFTLPNTSPQVLGVVTASQLEPAYVEYAALVQNVFTAEGGGAGTSRVAGAGWTTPIRLTANTDIKATASAATAVILVRVYQGCTPAQVKT